MRIWTCILLVSVAALFSCSRDSGPQACPGSVSHVSFAATSGAVDPFDQWSERTVILKSQVLFSRSGPPEATSLNSGTWHLDVDPGEVTALFEQLTAVDWGSLKEIRPEVPSAGEGERIYTVQCENGVSLTLDYAEGTTYANGRSITAPIEEFLTGLNFTYDVLGRYLIPEAPGQSP
jgi:hypothetical protein